MNTKKTEKELIETQNQNLFLVDQLLRKPNIGVDDIANLVPGLFHLNRCSDLVVEYLSPIGLKLFDLTMEEMRELGPEFFERSLAQETKEIVVPRFVKFAENQDSKVIYSDFQIVRRDYDAEFKPYISSLKILKEHDLFAVITIPVESFGEAALKMERIIGEQKFFRDNYQKFMSLTRREKEILGMVAIGNTNKEIGDKLFVSKDTVRTHRNNIFKKLNISRLQDVIKYAYAYDLFDPF